MSKQRLLVAGAALLALACGPSGALAQAIVSTGQSFVTARFIAGMPAAGGGRMAGLSLKLADGWKTYWRSPGEVGVPPSFDWSGSRNLRRAQILWPRPEMFDALGERTVGYAHQVVLPIRLVPEDPERPMDVRLKASLGVCRELCVLEQFTVDETIAPGEAPEGAGRIERALEAVPVPTPQNGLTAATCRIIGGGDNRRLEAELKFDRPLDAPVVLIEGPEAVWIGDTKTHADGGDLDISATVAMLDENAWIDRSSLRMTVLDTGFAADVKGCAAPKG